VLLGEPQRTPWDLHFSLLGIPVRVHPLFWVIAAVLGFNAAPPEAKNPLLYLFVWIAAVFLAVLVHELGHALVMRSYGFSPWVTLYGLGGLTSAGQAHAYRSRGADTWGQILISAAGPGAGFLLAAAIVGLLVLFGPGVEIFLIGGFLPYVSVGGLIGSLVFTAFVQYVLVVCIFWGIINLLPVYPLDGGQIAREILLQANPRDGIRQSLVLSIVTGVAVAVIGLAALRDPFIAVMFGLLAYFSYAALQAYSGRGPW
jgi:Zn-dependent protease